MDDLISRQDAIDALNGRKTAEQSTFGKARNNVVDWCVNAIKALPSAQPETTRRIVGKSKGGMTLWYECERCGEPVDEGDKFCRGCGAKMEVNNESN